ncbi:hypothetical protein [Cryobacterium frigoriphilum]|uniref:hypothetical protein n=1 Tax=Cryobacterium frigoriphilum TaxID=1259150 RepID=UPI001F54111C|nr:hypothetical protein [Cryobacterium frigoriphilum]
MKNNTEVTRRTDGVNQVQGYTSGDESHSSKAELRAKAADARAALASTLDAIEYKFNIPKQLRITRRRLSRALHELGEENGLALIGIALGAATVVGTVVWFGANAIVQAREK